MYIYERKINYYETDKMGIVHHSNYIRFFEEARCSLLEACDLPYDVMEEKGIMSPVLGVCCKYRQHVTFGDTVEIHAYIKEFSGVKFTVAYEIYNKETGALCVNGESNHCFTDSNLKPLNLKKHHLDVYEKFSNLVEKGTRSLFAFLDHKKSNPRLSRKVSEFLRTCLRQVGAYLDTHGLLTT